MNENIDLTMILKDCPKGFKLYSLVHGEVKFSDIDTDPISPWVYVTDDNNVCIEYTSDGKYSPIHNGECILFPSKDQRDWSKFTAPWFKKENKKERFDPKTLQAFDRVIVRDHASYKWVCDLFSDIKKSKIFPYRCIGCSYNYCIPYNDETKHLVGTTDEAPEYYRYWED